MSCLRKHLSVQKNIKNNSVEPINMILIKIRKKVNIYHKNRRGGLALKRKEEYEKIRLRKHQKRKVAWMLCI